MLYNIQPFVLFKDVGLLNYIGIIPNFMALKVTLILILSHKAYIQHSLGSFLSFIAKRKNPLRIPF